MKRLQCLALPVALVLLMPPTHRIRIPSTARLLFNGTREQRTSTFHISTIIGAFATKSFSASAACSSNECSLLTTASGRQPPPPSILTVYDPAIFKLLLRFLYHEEYPKGLDDSDPVVHAQLYAAAHFYRVDVLETLALFFFSAAVARLDRGTEQGRMRLADAIKPFMRRRRRLIVVSRTSSSMSLSRRLIVWSNRITLGWQFGERTLSETWPDLSGDPDLGGWIEPFESNAQNTSSAGPVVAISTSATWWSVPRIMEALWSLNDYYECLWDREEHTGDWE
ncbi:hypothetical protein IWX90DRAFT_1930 [Phyllosticta citrichinensis]|uniref:BTB domain-containing protein n=1 Tax=Phyllosticta citrichinensis TaxID=1130410 RepID=A0ABR1Y4Y2_9PEZI